MVRKLRVSLLLQPLATALFANSPFTEGRPNGFLSYRAHVWTDTDNRIAPASRGVVRARLRLRALCRVADRRGADVLRLSQRPLHRRGRRVVPRLHGRAAAPPSRARATVGDFADHITTVFTDVRLKRFLEMRGADAGRGEMMVAQSAFWVGLLYDEAALDRRRGAGARATWEDAVALRAAGAARRGWPHPGAAAPCATSRARWWPSRATGCGRRARSTPRAVTRSIHLAPLEALVAGAPTQAEHWLARFHSEWHG